MNERRTFPVAYVLNGLAQRAVTGQVVGSVTAEHAKTGKAGKNERNVSGRRLHIDGDRDRIAVVLDQIQHRELLDGRCIQRLPELTFAGSSLTDRDVGDLVR